MDERSCLPGFSARQGEQEVHGVVCISDGSRWVGARLAPGSSAARCSLCRKTSPWRGDVLAFYRHR